MLWKVLFASVAVSLLGSSIQAQVNQPALSPTSPDEFFAFFDEGVPGIEPIEFSEPNLQQVNCDRPNGCDNGPCCEAGPCCDAGPGCDCIACDSCLPGACDGCGADHGWLSALCGDKPALGFLQGQEMGPFTYSVGGELRYRFLNEHNRLRPPLNGRNSSYDQVRFVPYLELKYKDWVTGHVQAIDAPTFNHDLPQLPIDENRADLLQYYADFKVLDLGEDKLRFRAGRQFLQYGSQHLISPLGWSNTYRNFEGFKLYYSSSDWDIDGFAVQPVNGATGNFYRPKSYDTPDQSRWFSGVYATYKKAPKGTMDLYWIWLKEDADRVNRIDGNRHTIGGRYAGKHPINDDCDELLATLNWDVEGAYQFGTEDFLTGPNQDIHAWFLSFIGGATLNQVAWTPTLSGIFYYGSGDNNPADTTSRTVSTLFPLGHAYWGLIDNFSGQNLIDYGIQTSVKPTEKLTLLAAWHWFDKAAQGDAIYNIAGAPFGGVALTPANIGNELDLVATYAYSPSLNFQLGYFWFFYGDAVNAHPNALVANRDDAEQVYFMANWKF